MGKHTVVVAVALSLAMGVASAATSKAPTAKKPPLTMQFEVIMKRLGAAQLPAPGQPSEAIEKVYVKGAKRRVEGPSPWPRGNAKSRFVSISSGKGAIRWVVGEKQAFRTQSRMGRGWLFISDRPGWKQMAKKVGSQKLGDMQCDVYLLQPRERTGAPREPQGPRGSRAERGPTKVWIWTKYGLVAKQVLMSKDNKPLMIREVRKIVVGKSLADSLFQVPKGIMVKDAPQGERGFGSRPGRRPGAGR